MPSPYESRDISEELEEWIGSKRIQSVRLTSYSPGVDIHFSNKKFIRLQYDSEFEFTGEIEIHDRTAGFSGSKIVLDASDDDMLVFAHNILNSSKTNGFLYACGDFIEDLWRESDT